MYGARSVRGFTLHDNDLDFYVCLQKDCLYLALRHGVLGSRAVATLWDFIRTSYFEKKKTKKEQRVAESDVQARLLTIVSDRSDESQKYASSKYRKATTLLLFGDHKSYTVFFNDVRLVGLQVWYIGFRDI